MYKRTRPLWLLFLLTTFAGAAEIDLDDTALQARIQSAFDNSESYAAALVQVNSVRGFILLTGQVNSAESKSQATNTVVFASQDIRRVINELVVVPAIDDSTVFADEALAASITIQLAATDSALTERTTIVVHNDVVYLMGAFNNTEAALIAETVSKMPGVSNIKTAFEILSDG